MEDIAATSAKLGATLELALHIVENPAALLALLTAARKGIGTEGESALLLAMTALRSGAEAQIEIADRAIAMIHAASKHADETALAALGAGPVH